MVIPATLEVTQIDLADYRDDMQKCVRMALKQFVEDQSDKRYYQSSRSVASLIHDLMVFHARAIFEGRKGVSLSLKRNAFSIRVANKYIIKLKKLDPHLRTRNAPTNAVAEFVCQQLSFDAEGMQPATSLHLGYQSEGAEIASARIWITCPQGSRNVSFSWDLDDSRLATVVQISQEMKRKTRRAFPRETKNTATKKVDDGGENDDSSGT